MQEKNPRTAAAALEAADHGLLLLFSRHGPVDNRFAVASVV